MTAQVSDTVVHNGLVYSLAEYEGSGLFDPKDHGFEPVSFMTACWRGFICQYGVVDQQLILIQLRMGLSHVDSEKAKLLKVFGKDCSIDASDWLGATITNISLPVPFDGSMLIGRDFIKHLYVHMGFHPAYKYRDVWELSFHNGRLVAAMDISESMREHRKTHVEELPDPSDVEQTKKWIMDTFSRRRRDKS